MKKINQKGFSIIEVLIVLAIAGLIMLIVFLAVPALQRNARNNAIQNDAQSISGGVGEYASNNNGALPTVISGTGDVSMSRGSGSPVQTTKVQGSTVVSYGTTAPTADPTPGTIYVRVGSRCDGTASTRAFAVFYSTETSSGISRQCLDT
jgi:prepilin-type N-terminal cleavage/methylation domain-containing protein